MVVIITNIVFYIFLKIEFYSKHSKTKIVICN